MVWKPTVSEAFLIFYVVTIGAEFALGRAALIKARYAGGDTLAAVGMTVGNIVTNLLMAGVVFGGLTAAHGLRLFDIPPDSPWAWAALFVLDDFTYYVFHRISHECRLWWAAHVNHHSSRCYNLSTAIRQTWTGEIVGTWMPWIPLALLGFPPWMILTQQGFNLFYQFWIHTEAIDRMPRWFEYLFNTPSHHRVHHASNPRYLDRNYAGVLMIWDRLFGTFVEERRDEPPRYGILHDIDTHNPFRIAFHEWIAMARDLAGARTARDVVGIILGPPGWRQGETSKQVRDAWATTTPAQV
jgi:sterol desaturase/sphingolipid hydroxylase (fatty acid hydroxylase superfamily)